jgi:hypothetical protein
VRHMGGTSVIVTASPADRTVVAVLTNSSTGALFGRRLADSLFGIFGPPARAGQAPERPLAHYCGHYRSATMDVVVAQSQDGLLISDPLGSDGKLCLSHIDGATFGVDLGFLNADVTFLAGQSGPEIAYAHLALRALPRVVES